MSTFERLRGGERNDDARNGSVQYGEFSVASDLRAVEDNQNSESTWKVKELLQSNISLTDKIFSVP